MSKKFPINNEPVRTKLVEALVNCWKEAEDIFLEFNVSVMKSNLAELQKYLGLNVDELAELESLCNAWDI